MGRLKATAIVLAPLLAGLLLSACGGGSSANLLPGTTASQITQNLEQVRQQVGEGNCEGAEDSAAAVSTQVDELGNGVDKKLRAALAQGAERLGEVVESCEGGEAEEREEDEEAEEQDLREGEEEEQAAIEAEERSQAKEEKQQQTEEQKQFKEEEKQQKIEEKEVPGGGEKAGEGGEAVEPPAAEPPAVPEPGSEESGGIGPGGVAE
jgi:chemotaxis protein histidine kinase CheA